MAKRRDPSRGASILKAVTPKKDEKLVALARKRWHQAETADTKQRERELEDLQFYAGEQWPLDVLNSRQGQPGNPNAGLPAVPARPSYTINKVREPVRQVLNQERQSELGVEIVAVDDFGDATGGITPEEIELREGLVRRIQRDSQASDARSWAFARSTIAGRGYWRVMTRYVGGRSFDQDIYIDRIYNQASVLMDPAHEQPDGSDSNWGFIGSDVPWDIYKAEYGRVGDEPNGLLSTSNQDWRALGDELPGWFSIDDETRSVRVVEYWYVERDTEDIVQLVDGRVIPADEMADGDEVATDDSGEELRRTEVVKTVKWVKLDGVQVLEQTDWPGKYLPIIKVVGEELQPFNDERRAEGMVRPARDSQKGFNVMVSKWVEQIGLAPIPPWMMAEGQDEGYENEYQLANTRTLPALHFKQVDLEGRPAGPPTRTSITTDIAAIAGSVQLFDSAIKSTTQVPDSSLGNVDHRVRSKVAIDALVQNASQGTSHFLDNLQRSIRYEGIIVNDLLYAIYGRPGRLARMIDGSGEAQSVPLHVPTLNGQATPSQTDGAKTYTLTPDVSFNVTVKVTKNLDTRRQQQESLLAEIVQADPTQMGIIGDLLWKYNDSPGHEALEQRYRAVLIPPVAALVNGQTPIPPQAQAQIAQLTQANQELQQKADANQTKMTIAAHGDALETWKTQVEAQTKITVAEISAKSSQAVADMKAQIDVLSTLIGTAKEERLAEKQHAHEASTTLHEAAHDVALTAMQHNQQTALADQSHQNALEQGAQPPPIDPNTPPAPTDTGGQ